HIRPGEEVSGVRANNPDVVRACFHNGDCSCHGSMRRFVRLAWRILAARVSAVRSFATGPVELVHDRRSAAQASAHAAGTLARSGRVARWSRRAGKARGSTPRRLPTAERNFSLRPAFSCGKNCNLRLPDRARPNRAQDAEIIYSFGRPESLER